MNDWIRIAAIVVCVALGVFLLVKWHSIKPVPKEDEHFKAVKKRRGRFRNLGILALWIASGLLFGLLREPSGESLHVSLSSDRIMLFGLDLNMSIVLSVAASLLIILAAVLIRVFAIPKFGDKPKGIQNVLETMVEAIDGYVKEKSGLDSENLNAYFLTLAILLVVSACMELLSFRPPIADLTVTGSMAICTFILINYFGIKRNGLGGRLKQYTRPTAIVAPFKLLTDIAIPVSLACRLFGNMLGGMVVMHLLYMALGSFGVGIPAVAGLYFNAFHPLIQAFIFITLSLTFIGEAAEMEEEHHEAHAAKQKA
ncbi:MAG: FoF1 ATP synthase subunit a [Clostridiaceae bacterium]|nr:F0F1 ATP synthase subunit A [Eubacteriales bacterium]